MNRNRLMEAATDVVSQVPQGFNSGLDGMLNLPYNLVRGAAGIFGYDMPEAQPIVARLNTGESPRTTVGRYAHTVGEFLPGIMAPGQSLARNALLYAALPGVASEAAGQATEGTSAEPYARLAAALAAPATPSVLSKANALADRAGVLKYDPNTLYATGGPGKVEAATVVAEETPIIRAYHGSPHDFDRFDMSKIGTGEGHQSFGHGLYFAGNEDVAKQYRAKLADRPDVLVDGKKVDIYKNNQDALVAAKISSRAHEMSTLGNANVNMPDVIASVSSDIDSAMMLAQKSDDFDLWRSLHDQKTAIQRMSEADISFDHNGRMYEVNIAADPEHFLDWDKPLSAQNEFVSTNLRNVLKPSDRMPSDWIKHSPGAEERLNEAGIPGIKYFDQGSRADGKGSHNYVVFDDALISIVRKYGIGPALGLGLISAEQAKQLQEAGY